MRWVVGSSDGGTVRAVLERAQADGAAIGDGRVFVGRRRVRTDGERVTAGDVVEIAPPKARSAGDVCVLFETSDLVAVDKPAGTPTIADHGGAAHALLAWTARTLGVDPSCVHPTSRLDRDVSGVVVFARTKDAADRLAKARKGGAYERRYVAIVSPSRLPDHGEWNEPIGRSNEPRLRRVSGRDAVAASTRFAVCARVSSGHALLAVAPATGRTHQIRVHAANAGAPLLGDHAYGGPARITLATGRVLEPRRIALHAARVVVPDDRGAPLAACSPVPRELTELWGALGGAAGAWEVATSCALG